MIEKIGVQDYWGTRNFVFKLFLDNNQIVFMRVKETPCLNDERYIIIVKADEFYKKWTGKSLEKTNIIINDFEKEKYKDAEKGFSYGISNPVPLAEICCNEQIGFIDSITRTKWLLKHGAKCFPVECNKNSADNLLKIAYNGEQIKTVHELLQGL